MKKIVCLFLVCLLLLGVTGCGTAPEDSEKIQVICTVFPQYDWVRSIIGEDNKNVELTLLMDNGADLHNYQATVSDLMAIAACDLFIYVGGESDSWVADALQNPTNPERKTLALLDVVEPLENISVNGEEEHHHEEEEEHEHLYDEHVWLSLKNADKLVEHIAAYLGEVDPERKETYRANGIAYREKLQELEGRYRECVDTGKRKTMVFADRFPFRYLANDYGLECYAAFSGCSAETEASFATLSFLTEKVNEHDLPAVLVIETSDRSIAKTVIANSESKDQQILVVDSLQSVTQARIDSGETYLSIMENNLLVLKQALN
ncbi:MAG: zinc ABC transporter substrate-binding protein [Clostridia bacterium]|nr:zinc ABC transporter substrate-binding protein [Clostridia bacterium]